MEIVIRAAAVFAFLWLLTRAMGKKELAELSAFELVLLVVIGDLVQQGVTQEDMSVTGAILGAILAAARGQGIASLAEVVVGVLEPDGRFAFVRRDVARPPPVREARR
ncbi:MAG TPA: hypothetical protein VF029_03450 [Actinomycetota bacterium]